MASIGMAVAQGDVGQCEVVDAPAGGPPPMEVGAGVLQQHGEGAVTLPEGGRIEQVQHP
jgi:hypothetical protein